MTDSLTKRIVAATVAAIGATGAPTGVTVNKMRETAVALNELPMYSVYLASEQAAPIGQSRRPAAIKRTLDLAVKIRVNGTDDDIDPHRQWIIAQMGADASLGGLASYTEESSCDWFAEEASDGVYTAAVITFNVEYQTKPSDITARG